MTIQELYQRIEGDYNQAISVLRVDRLVDKHIRRFAENGVVETFLSAGDSMNPSELFETAHVLKEITANLGLVKLSEISSEITEEYRPGKIQLPFKYESRDQNPDECDNRSPECCSQGSGADSCYEGQSAEDRYECQSSSGTYQ